MQLLQSDLIYGTQFSGSSLVAETGVSVARMGDTVVQVFLDAHSLCLQVKPNNFMGCKKAPGTKFECAPFSLFNCMKLKVSSYRPDCTAI